MSALIVAAIGLLIWPADAAARRLRRLLLPSGPGSAALQWNPVRLTAGGAAVAIFVLSPGLPGLLIGAAVACALDRYLRRLETGSARRHRRERAREFPVALDLLSIALRAGLPVTAAAGLVATALEGPLAEDLRRVGALCALGADPPMAWSHFRDDPLWSEVARSVARAADSGSALSGLLRRIAEDRRSEQEQAAHAAARRASVIAMAPLGLCFLPAFVCLGIVPVVVGLLSHAVL
ncbi:MAG TPA: type II secretion system F family protein [Mycobacteriales bacterium]|nr:type II secretion system F family protein [Mycobacteriales bacterium]